MALPPHRYTPSDPVVTALLCEHVGGHFGLEPAGSEEPVYPDSLAGPLGRQLTREVDDAAFRRGVAGLRDRPDADKAENRRDVDDRPRIPAGQHGVGGALGECEWRDEIDLQDAKELLYGSSSTGDDVDHASVVDEYADPAEMFDCGLDGGIDLRRDRQVTRERQLVIELRRQRPASGPVGGRAWRPRRRRRRAPGRSAPSPELVPVTMATLPSSRKRSSGSRVDILGRPDSFMSAPPVRFATRTRPAQARHRPSRRTAILSGDKTGVPADRTPGGAPWRGGVHVDVYAAGSRRNVRSPVAARE